MWVEHVECPWHFVCILCVQITKLYLLVILEKQVKSHPLSESSISQLLGPMYEEQVKDKYLTHKYSTRIHCDLDPALPPDNKYNISSLWYIKPVFLWIMPYRVSLFVVGNNLLNDTCMIWVATALLRQSKNNVKKACGLPVCQSAKGWNLNQWGGLG